MILGARAPICLEWARAFHASGWRVSVADSISWPLTRTSRMVDRFVRLPEPRYAHSDWVATLRKEIIEQGIDLLLPTCEEVFYLSSAMAELPTSCRIFTSNFALLHRLHHKGWFASLTDSWPVKAPETRLLESQLDVQAFAHESVEWVFKPAYSRFAVHTLIKPRAAELSRINPTTQHPWVAQRFVDGREHCSFSLIINGKLTAHACYHPRHRVGRGSGIWFEPTDPPELRSFLQQFGQMTGYTGQIGFDFIEDREGNFHVLECNPRGTSGLHLFDDQPLALIEALSERQIKPLYATNRPRMVAMAMLLFGTPRLMLKKPRAWRNFWLDYKMAKDVITRRNDLGPLFTQIPGLAEIVSRAISRRCSMLAAATADIEWDGQPLDGTNS